MIESFIKNPERVKKIEKMSYLIVKYIYFYIENTFNKSKADMSRLDKGQLSTPSSISKCISYKFLTG